MGKHFFTECTAVEVILTDDNICKTQPTVGLKHHSSSGFLRNGHLVTIHPRNFVIKLTS